MKASSVFSNFFIFIFENRKIAFPCPDFRPHEYRRSHNSARAFLARIYYVNQLIRFVTLFCGVLPIILRLHRVWAETGKAG